MQFLKANTIFDGKQYLPQSSVLVIDSQNKLKEIISETALEKDKIEFFDGIITPGFVNAHCHLELSHLKNKIQKHTGIPEFGKQIISKRMSGFTKEQIYECANNADAEMILSTLERMDISNRERKLKEKYAALFLDLSGRKVANGL